MSRALPDLPKGHPARAADGELRAMQTGRYVIALPLPARDLQPNSRTHWRIKAQRVREARSEAACAVFAAYGSDSTSRAIAKALVTVQCTFGDRRRRDLDNMLAALKPSIDGIVDSGLLKDDSGLTYMIPPARVEKGAAGVQITIEEVA